MRVMIGVMTLTVALSTAAMAEPPADGRGIEALCREIANGDDKAFHDCVLDERTAQKMISAMPPNLRSKAVDPCLSQNARYMGALECVHKQFAWSLAVAYWFSYGGRADHWSPTCFSSAGSLEPTFESLFRCIYEQERQAVLKDQGDSDETLGTKQDRSFCGQTTYTGQVVFRACIADETMARDLYEHLLTMAEKATTTNYSGVKLADVLRMCAATDARPTTTLACGLKEFGYYVVVYNLADRNVLSREDFEVCKPAAGRPVSAMPIFSCLFGRMRTALE